MKKFFKKVKHKVTTAILVFGVALLGLVPMQAQAEHICYIIEIPPVPWLYVWCPPHPPYP